MHSESRGSVHAGLGEWIVQRVSAIYLLIFIIGLSLRLLIVPVSNHEDWLVLSSSLLFRVTLLLFIVSLLAHAWIGLRSVMMDYVHPWRLRFFLLMLFAFVLIGMGAWAGMVLMG